MRLFIGIIVFFTIFAACSSSETTNYEVGSDFLDSDVIVRVIDTFTINTGTFKLDDVATSSTGRILLGHINDDKLGSTSSQSYFQLSTSSFSIDNDATYDSIAFVMNYDTYYTGDTLQRQTYTFHRIKETVDTEDDATAFYNTDELDYDDKILGEVYFRPRPNTASDSLYIPVSDDLGLEIFDAIQDGDINSSDDFIQEYKGFTIVPDTTAVSHILGFNTLSSTNVANNSSLRLYYTIEDGDNEDNSYYIDFVVTDTSKLFNSISSNFSDSANAVFNDFSDDLYDSENTISSDDTDELFYIQGGSGLTAKIEIPSIKRLGTTSDYGTPLSAELTFKPSASSYRNVDDLQDSLLVYLIDDKNRIQSQLTDADGVTAYALLNENIERFNSYYYSVDVTGFVETILNSESDLEYDLMIQFNDFDRAVENIAIEAENNSDNKLKLSVKYLNY